MPTKKKSKPSFNKKRLIIVTLATVVAIALVLFATNTLLHNRNQELLAQDLEKSGLALDTLVNEFETAIPGIEIVRSENCYRSSRKFSEGPIYCRQSINFTEEGLSDEQVVTKISILESTILSTELFDFSVRSKRGDLLLYTAKTEHKDGGCTASIAGIHVYNKPRDDYEIQVECLSGDFDEFIYPELEN